VLSAAFYNLLGRVRIAPAFLESHPMTTPQQKNRWRQWLQWALQLLAGAAGFKFGFDFGYRLDGAGIGILMALNSALFCSIMAGAVVGRLLPLSKAERDQA
jgi:hypothetical protein